MFDIKNLASKAVELTDAAVNASSAALEQSGKALKEKTNKVVEETTSLTGEVTDTVKNHMATKAMKETKLVTKINNEVMTFDSIYDFNVYAENNDLGVLITKVSK